MGLLIGALAIVGFFLAFMAGMLDRKSGPFSWAVFVFLGLGALFIGASVRLAYDHGADSAGSAISNAYRDGQSSGLLAAGNGVLEANHSYRSLACVVGYGPRPLMIVEREDGVFLALRPYLTVQNCVPPRVMFRVVSVGEVAPVSILDSLSYRWSPPDGAVPR